MATSACVGDATTVEAVAELFEEVGSPVAEATVGLMEIVVPGAVVETTFTTSGKLTVVFAAIVATVQGMDTGPAVPTAGVVQDHPAGTPSETNVVLAGTDVVNVSVAAATGPPLLTVSVNVMLFPSRTGLGEADAVTARSACVAVATGTFAVASLLVGLGSGVAELIEAVSEITVPAAVPAVTFNTG